MCISSSFSLVCKSNNTLHTRFSAGLCTKQNFLCLHCCQRLDSGLDFFLLSSKKIIWQIVYDPSSVLPFFFFNLFFLECQQRIFRLKLMQAWSLEFSYRNAAIHGLALHCQLKCLGGVFFGCKPSILIHNLWLILM